MDEPRGQRRQGRAPDADALRSRPRRTAAREAELPADVRAELTGAVGRQQGDKLAERMAAGVRAYERDRYGDAFRITKPLVQMVPESAAARELHGLVCYRLGRWREAIRHLDAARDLMGDDPSQLPVLMDCHRAQGHHRRVAYLWEELRAASPDADVLAEGRLVFASDLADQGKLDRAVSVLTTAGAGRNLRHPADRHIRQWYVLADLLERGGDVSGARRLFSLVAEADPELADARVRLAALGDQGRGGTRRRR
ncbi:MAG: hypothetical protein ACYDA2_03340 [Acidimicrobiales bacterium]